MNKRQRIGGIIAAVGIITLLGAAGSSDLGVISAGSALIQGIIGLLVTLVGLLLGGYMQ